MTITLEIEKLETRKIERNGNNVKQKKLFITNITNYKWEFRILSPIHYFPILDTYLAINLCNKKYHIGSDNEYVQYVTVSWVQTNKTKGIKVFFTG